MIIRCYKKVNEIMHKKLADKQAHDGGIFGNFNGKEKV